MVADTLRQHFSENAHWHFSEEYPGLPLIHIHNQAAQATISLYGGQVLSYQPEGEEDVLWLSGDAVFSEGHSIRGGIPVCWPWFGPHPDDPAMGAHGYARKRSWQLESVESSDRDSRLALTLPRGPSDDLALKLDIVVGCKLKLALTSENLGNTPYPLTAALHSYFAVSDIHEIQLSGLEDKPFRDAVNDNRQSRQRGSIRFSGELDRVYQEVDNPVLIHDPGLERRIRVHNTGSRSVVVWNPWAEKAERLGDMGEAGYQSMVCVETANADTDRVILGPGEQHCLAACIEID